MINKHFIALRGLAIVLIVLSHSVTLSIEALQPMGYPQPPELERIVLVALQQLGLVTVPTFLFLSGCFMVYAVHGKQPLPAYRTIWANLKHVLWPYFIWSIIFYIAVYWLRHDRFTPAQYVKDLIVGYPYNFVPLLVFFYLASPILVYVARRAPWPLLIVTGVYQLFLVNVNSPGALLITFPAWTRLLAPPILRSTLGLWAVHFPLGVVYALHWKAMLPWLQRGWRILALAGVAFYGLRVLALMRGQYAPVAEALCPVPVVVLFPLLKRESIPLVRQFEQYGRKAYGLYLTNLIVISFALAGIAAIAPWFLRARFLLVPALFAITLAAPLWLMSAFDRLPNRAVQRYVFG